MGLDLATKRDAQVGFRGTHNGRKPVLNKLLPVFMGMGLLTVMATSWAEAQFTPFPLFINDCEQDVGELQSKLAMLAKEKSTFLTAVQKMKEILSQAEKEQREPDPNRLKAKGDVWGGRSADYQKDSPYIKGLFDHHEAMWQPYNLLDIPDLAQLMLRKGWRRAYYVNEIERAEHYIQDLDDEKERINRCLKLHEAKRNNDQPECPSGTYLVACDPGMGGDAPFISDAMQPGQGFQGGPSWGSGQPQPPGYTGTEPRPGAGQPGATGAQPPIGYPPYQCGYPGYPPCPPGYRPPYDPSGEPPWKTPIPASGPRKPKPPMGGGSSPGGCPPGQHISPETGKCHSE